MTSTASIEHRPARKPAVREPRQKRSQIRVQAILDAAERLLDSHDSSEISIYAIAEDASISPPSVYHFFPDSNQVFLALSERIHARFVEAFEVPPEGHFATWQDLMLLRFRQGQDYYNTHAAARRLLLGSGLSATIRARDLEIDRQLAVRSLEEMRRHFLFPDTPEIEERFTELLVINDALWALSVHRHGLITDAYEEQARRAREAYSRTFLPEYLPRRPSEEIAA